MINMRKTELTKEDIEGIRSGNIKAFERLFNLYYLRVKNFTLGIIKNTDDAEEIAQNVFLKLWMNRQTLSEHLSINSYIFTITQNEVYDLFREQHYSLQYRESLTQTINSEIEDEIEAEYNVKEIKNIVAKTIESMPEQRRLIFKLSREQFLSNDEIAEKLNLSKRTVEKHISLALTSIRKNLGDFLFWLFIFLIR